MSEGERDERREVGDEALGAEAKTRRASCNAVYKLANKNRGEEEEEVGGEVGFPREQRTGTGNKKRLAIVGRPTDRLLLDFYKVDA